MMASSSSSSDLSADHHLLQDDFPWPSSLPLAPALHHSHTIGGNHQWSQPLMLEHLSSDELEALLSAQGHHHNHSVQLPAAPTPHQLSSLLMMQELGFQWSNCAVAETETPMLITTSQQDSVKEEEDPRSSTIAYHDGAGLPELDGAVVLPSVNVSRLQKPCLAAAAAAAAAGPLAGGDTFEMVASARLCKSLLSQAAASSAVLVHNGGMPLLREYVPYGSPPAHRLQGPSIYSYKMGVPAALVSGNGNENGNVQAGRGGHGSSASCHEQQLLQAAISKKKPRLDSRSSTTMVPSFKVRKEKLGDRIAALQQLVSPFGKTDTASVLMEAIGYIKFLQDQVETLSGPYMRSSKHKKARTTHQRGPSNAGEKDEAKLDLRSRGLCLVPLSCTSYVTNENGVWAPHNFRGN